MEYHIRYETPDENGETRRERNEKFGMDHLNPIPVELGSYAQILWSWYKEATEPLVRVRDGIAIAVSWSEWQAWQQETGTIVRPTERAILRAIDRTFVRCLDVELSELRARQEEKRELENSKRRGR